MKMLRRADLEKMNHVLVRHTEVQCAERIKLNHALTAHGVLQRAELDKANYSPISKNEPCTRKHIKVFQCANSK